MIHFRLLISLLLSLALAGAALAQTTYRWVDRDGGVHYSDDPPPAEARNAQQKTLGDNVIESGGLPFAVRYAAERFPVTLYTTSDCADLCRSGRELLKRRGVPFTEKVVHTKADSDALGQALGGDADPQVPSLTVGRSFAKGYLEAQWNALLDAAGYPKSAP